MTVKQVREIAEKSAEQVYDSIQDQILEVAHDTLDESIGEDVYENAEILREATIKILTDKLLTETHDRLMGRDN